MSTDTKAVETALASSHEMLTVADLCLITSMEKKAVEAQLKALAQQGQIDHKPKTGRFEAYYGLLRTTPQAPAGGDSEGGEAGVRVATTADANSDTVSHASDANQNEMYLLNVIADIRAAIGDKTGKIMLGELAAHIATIYRLGGAHREACMTWERSMMGAIGEDGTGSVAAAIEELKADLANAKALAEKFEHLLGSERTACAALREQLDRMTHSEERAGLDASMIDSFAVIAPKRPMRRFTAHDSAVKSAMAAASNGSKRGEVFALVHVGSAKRGAVWRPAK